MPVHLAGQDVGAVSPLAPTLPQVRLLALVTIGLVIGVTRVQVTWKHCNQIKHARCNVFSYCGHKGC